MKKIIILVSICCAAFGVKAQGNLQFSSAKLIILNKPSQQTTVDTVIIIPPGKTWKIEKTIHGDFIGSKLKMNDVVIGQAQFVGSGYASSYSYSIDGPLWLPEGTYTFSFYSGGGGNVTDKCLISALEFNIIP